MEDSTLQKELFQHIKNSLPSHISMVDEIGDILGVSFDSAYRRIRGEKLLSLTELKILCDRFQLSLDLVLQLHTNKVLFTDLDADGAATDFKSYLEGILKQLQYYNSFKNRQLLYLAKDLPIFYFFYFKEITAFKSFFWSKSILNDPAFEGKNFCYRNFEVDTYFELGQKIIKAYNILPCTELWNYESINSTVLQIQYCRDAGIFESTKDLNLIVDSCDAMLQHLQKQVEKGCKFLPGTGAAGYGAAFKLYINEIILGNNSLLVEIDERRIAIINHIVLKYISTTDKRFTNKAFDNFQNLVSRSMLISETAERERSKFFNAMRERVRELKK